MDFITKLAQKNALLVNQIVKPAGSAKIMSSADDISSWYEAVQYYEADRIDEAIEKFKSVKQSAKMLLNLACCHLRKNELKTAKEILTKAVTGDPHLALGFFMLGLTNYIEGDYNDSLQCFEKTFTLLRGNRFVDYRQLGFKYQLYSCEVLTNTAAVHSKLDNIDKAKEKLLQAFESKAEKKHDRIFDAIQELQSDKPIQLFVPPKSEVFRPSKAAVANIKKKDYLGTSKVISTDSEEDCYACFSGIKDKVVEQKKAEQENNNKPTAAKPKADRGKLFSDLKSGNRRKTLFRVKEPEVKPATEGLGQVVQMRPIGEEGNKKQRPVSACPPASALPAFPDQLDVVDASPRRAMSLGERPKKALPELTQPKKPLPTLKVVPSSPQVEMTSPPQLPVHTHQEAAVVPTTQITVESSPPNAEEVEIEIQYSFISKIRLAKGSSLTDLQSAAAKQELPRQVEFRISDNLGRQIEVTEEQLKRLLTQTSQRNIIQCYPASS